MAWRLNDDIIAAGVINNTERNSIRGHIYFKTQEFPLILNLTGNCTDIFAGRHFRFTVRDQEVSPDLKFDRTRLADQQIGPPGRISIDYVRWFPGSVEQAYLHSKLGEPPPMYWKPRLYFEWYSQNGNIVLELLDPKIEFNDLQKPDQIDIGEPPFPDPNNPPKSQPPDITEVTLDEEGNFNASEISASFSDDKKCEDDDPYNLFPDNIEELIRDESDSSYVDEPDEETKKMFEQMDTVTYGTKDEPVCTLFDPPIKLPKEENLNDEQIDEKLHELLMRMAMLSISLNMCKHYTSRRAYKLLTETLLKDAQVYPGLLETGYVQHYTTHEFCEECDREIEEDYKGLDKKE